MLKHYRGSHCRFILIPIILLTLLYIVIYSFYSLFTSRFFIFSSHQDDPSSSLEKDQMKFPSQLMILAWTDIFEKPYPLDGLFRCRNREITQKCTIINDRKLLNISSAVIFHVRDISYMDMPQFKPDGTKFVFFSHEPPEMTFIILKGLPMGYFDWTMTYKIDSDIYCPYGYVEQVSRPLPIDNSSWMKYVLNKTKLIAWYVSNCQTDSKRERYVFELKKHINVDVYGKCGTKNSCPKSNWSDCNDYLRYHYKFYLSLENSACKDYVTEKFFHRLSAYIVPIVLRRSDYVKIAPNMSFIALDDFSSPKHLAEYLLRLDKNNEEYLEYFSWRKKYEVVTDKMSKYCYCDLCEKLWREKQTSNSLVGNNRKQNKKKVDIHQWWYVDGACDHKYAYKLLKRKTP